MKKFIKFIMAMLIVVPCMLVMVACDKISATGEVPPIMDQPVVEGPTPEEPVDPEDPVDPVAPVDNYQAINNQTEFAAALAAAQPGSTTYLRLNKNMVVSSPLIVNTKVVLDLNGKTLLNNKDIWNADTKAWSLISVRQNGNLVINGDGKLQAKANDCFAIDLQDEHARCTINGGTYIGNISAIYVKQGRLTINDGTFKIQQTADDKPFAYVLNCLDANYQNGTARVWVYGGKFENFNPAVCGAESEADNGTNFVTKGYQAVVAKVIYNDGENADNQVVYNPSAEQIDAIKTNEYQIVNAIYQVEQAPAFEIVDDNNGLTVEWHN